MRAARSPRPWHGVLSRIAHSAVVIEKDADVAAIAKAESDYQGVVYVYGGGEVFNPAAAAEAASVEALQFVQGLTRASLKTRLWLVTAGAAAVADLEPASDETLAQTPVWGFVRTLALEHPELRPGWIDLPAQPEPADLDSLAREAVVSNRRDAGRLPVNQSLRGAAGALSRRQ